MISEKAMAAPTATVKNYKLLADEDIIGNAEESNEDEDELLKNDPNTSVTSKWKKL